MIRSIFSTDLSLHSRYQAQAKIRVGADARVNASTDGRVDTANLLMINIILIVILLGSGSNQIVAAWIAFAGFSSIAMESE